MLVPVVAAAAAFLLLPAGATAKPAGVKVEVLTKGQARLLASGGLTVRVRAKRPIALRLSASVRGARRTRAFRGRKLRVGAAGKRRRAVTLRLRGPGRRLLGECGSHRVRVVARRRGKGKGKRRWRAGRELRRDSSRCAPELPPIDTSRAGSCDFIAEPGNRVCLMPFPNDYYTRPDPSSPTGRRVELKRSGMPTNALGSRIEPAPWNRSDGFSPGAAIVLKVPGIDTAADVEANDVTPINRLGRYGEPTQRIVLIDAVSGERQPIWSEIDSHAADPENAALMIHPATNLRPGRRYIVALRNLTNAAGESIEAPAAFRYYRDQVPSPQPEINARRAHFESLFAKLGQAGIPRGNLYLAWDFTVASDENNYGRALSMRDQAFAELGDTTMADLEVQGDAPEFAITDVQEFTPVENARIARRITGTYEIPCFLAPSCDPGGTLKLDPQGNPERTGTWTAPFTCIVPQVGVEGADPDPLRPYVYGHGLFGRGTETAGGVNPQLTQEHGFVACGTDEIGMSQLDLPMIAGILGDLSAFPRLADRLQQGLVNELFLERLMHHPDGLAAEEAFRVDRSEPESPSVIDTEHVFYMGASQGGIMGGPLTALSPDVTRSALLVGAMRYSLLLPRSIDYVPYAALLNNAYRDELSRPLLFSLIQMLWDRGEPNGYANRMTDDPPPRTPPHEIVLMIALGDHQVSNFASEIEARSVGMSTRDPVLDPGRWPGYDVLWNVPRFGPDPSDYPFRGSAIIYLDGGPMREDPPGSGTIIGTTPPPFANVPNTAGEDPHGAPRGADAAVAMTATFLQPDGYIEDVCGPGKPCYGGGWAGLP